MRLISIFLVSLVGVTFLVTSVFGVLGSKKDTGLRRWLTTIGWSFVAVGASGFFGMAFLVVGGHRWLPSNFEWPIGFADGILTMTNGIYVVPHTPTGRIQIYDANWKFQRGWFVDASAGTFKLRIESSNRIEMITARGQMRYVYGLDGTIVAGETYAPKNYGDFSSSAQAAFVPTHWWLWTFTGPFYSWGLVAVGGGLLVGADRIKKRRKKAP